MAALMFLYPRDLVEIFDQVCDNPEQQRSHVVGCSEINGIEVMSDFYVFLVKNGIVPEAIKTIVRDETDIRPGVLMDDTHDKGFYVTCPAGEIHRLLIVWSRQWRAEHGYSELPLEARAG
jgi:hypothetical protein